MSARTVLPPKFTDLRVPVINLHNNDQVLVKGTKLGTLEKAEEVEPAEDGKPLSDSTFAKSESKSLRRAEAIDQMIEDLPEELNDEQRRQVKKLLRQNEGIFSKGEHDIGRTQLIEYRIDTGDHRPIRQSLRRQPFQHLEIIDKQVKDMKDAGIIESAASPWAFNVVLVKKKDGNLRFCVDYRRLNAITYKDSYPLPLIDNCLNALSGSSWFSTLDLRSGYYNIPIAEEDRDKSAFITRSGCFRFTVMPFGLTCAPSVFQRLMDFVLGGLHYLTCLVYIDDIIIFGKSFDQQLERLGEVFDRIRQANLKLKPSKCSLFRRNVEFLGHVVSKEGIAMQEDKVKAIKTWPSPRNLTELRAFMGTSGYYRRFVKDFSTIAAPLFALMKKGVTWEWTDECEEVFEGLKAELISKPILALPTDDGTCVFDSDASDFGLGAVLSQTQNGEERVIAFASRTLSKPELKYEVTRKELLAVVFGLKQFRQYLLGRHIILRTDNAALSWLRRTPEPMPQLARWLTLIEQYDYEVQHREGKRHGNADGLSRRPVTKEVRINGGGEAATETEDSENLGPEELLWKIRVLEKPEYEVHAKVREPSHEGSDPQEEGTLLEREDVESLQERQKAHKELGRLISLRLTQNEAPEFKDLSMESEVTKKLCLQWKNLEIHNGLVYRKLLSQRGGEPGALQLLVPRGDVKDVLRQSHIGHFGIRKTQDQVKRKYYWPSWKEDTKRFCERCLECNTYCRGKPKKQGPLKPVLAGAPYERWYIDLTGPHPKSTKGNIWIMTCLDGFTKWAEAYPLRNKEAETIARTLVEQLFCRFGPPLSILSDQGKEVDGRIMNEVCRLFGVTKLRTTPNKPSTNQVERFHRTMNAILAKTIDDHHRDWDSQLPFAMAAYRASRHKGTDYSPNFLVLGTEVHMPLDLMYGTPDESYEDYDAFVEDKRERIVDAFTDVRTVLRRSAERNKRYYDISVKTKSYEEGQWVLYFNLRKYRGIQMKWKRQYEGPYLITRVMSPLTVEIQRSAKARPKVVHVDKLREFLGIPPSSWLDTHTAPDEGDASDLPPVAADQSSPEPGVSSANTTEGTATSVTAVDDSPAEGQPPKAADEVLELVELVEKAAGMPAAEVHNLETVPMVEKLAAEGLVGSATKATGMPVADA